MHKGKSKKNTILIISVIAVILVAFIPGNSDLLGYYFDKPAHFGIFFLLALNLFHRYDGDKKTLTVLLGLLAVSVVVELIQRYIPGRCMDFYDAIANVLGVTTACYVYYRNKIFINRLLLKLGGSA